MPLGVRQFSTDTRSLLSFLIFFFPLEIFVGPKLRGPPGPIWRAGAVRFAQRFFRNLMECGTKRSDRGSGEHEFSSLMYSIKSDYPVASFLDLFWT